jgi:hypothetical protein|tara:strand:+ start:879 stop:1043 length:165 start_codon:yes stop_codon:yes gene_type:complete
VLIENNPHPPIEQLGFRISLAKRAFDQANSNDFKALWAAVHSHLLRRLQEYDNG